MAIHLQGCASVMNGEHLESRQEKESKIDGHEKEEKKGERREKKKKSNPVLGNG